MKMRTSMAIFVLLFLLASCKQKSSAPSPALVKDMNLKRGPVVSCGPPGSQFGSVDFPSSCTNNVKEEFNLAVKLLHSFEYDEAEKMFAAVIDMDPGCAMAYWGVAMANFHPLWTPPNQAELEKGSRASQVAQSLAASEREKAYINAIAGFYQNWQNTDHRTRCLNFEKAMEKVYASHPDDKEAAIFYALALDAAAEPADKTFVKQQKAGEILNGLYPDQPNHPGITHYLIHTYDYPQLAQRGLEAARRYAAVAPSSAHALHMPSHIFTRLGLWEECLQSNRTSVASARCYAEATGIKGNWDEELHGLDYLVYAFLQKGASDSAKAQLDYLQTIHKVQPMNFKVAYAFAAIPSRYFLENRLWAEAAKLKAGPNDFPWKAYPWQEAIVHFARLLGAVHTDNPANATVELTALKRLHDTLRNQNDAYKAGQVAIQIKTGEAWISLQQGKEEEALSLMQTAAALEDKTEKHPVTPGEVLPARELLGDMLLQLNQPAKALEAYVAVLQTHPNRFNALYGAGLAAQKAGNAAKAEAHFGQLVAVVGDAKSTRPEYAKCVAYLHAVAAR